MREDRIWLLGALHSSIVARNVRRMTGRWLIDLTDDGLKTPENDDVMSFIRRVNPFAHSDLGSVLLALGKAIPGSHAYCPSYGSCAYVVLHDDAKRIVAIAWGQRALAFRLAHASHAAAFADGGVAATDIGDAWVAFDPFDPKHRADVLGRLAHWCAQAFADAATVSSSIDA